MIFTLESIFLDQTFKTQHELFEAIAKTAKEKDLVASSAGLIRAFQKREQLGTTGFEKGFAIPHARAAVVKQPAVFIVRNKIAFSDWKALDQGGVHVAICLLIPLATSSDHVRILAAFAQHLMDASFRNDLKTGTVPTIYQLVSGLLANIKLKAPSKVESNPKTSSKKQLLVGISACPAGIAHTFMAKEKMEQLARHEKMEIKWETQGANGQQNALTKADISRADYIIIASDIELDLSRFKDVAIYKTSTSEVIKNARQVLARAKTNTQKPMVTRTTNLYHEWARKLLIAFKSQFARPWTYFTITATLLGLTSLIGFSIYGQAWRNDPISRNADLYRLQLLAAVSLYLALPLVAANVARQLTKQSSSYYIVFVGALILNLPAVGNGFNTISGFASNALWPQQIFYSYGGAFNQTAMQFGANVLGSIVVTFGVALVIIAITKVQQLLLASKKHYCQLIARNGDPWLTITLPAAIMLFGIVFMGGGPLSYLNSKIIYGLIIYPNDYWWLRFLIGAIFGVAIAWDLGGTVNKITIIALIGIAQYDLRIGSIIPVAIPTASFGLGLTYWFNKSEFQDSDQKEVSKSLERGLKGMSEGPLLLTNKYGWRVKLPNLIATGIAAGLVYMFGIYIFKGGLTGILVFGAQAHLATSNDLASLSDLVPLGAGLGTFLSAVCYGIIAYYLVMASGALSYLAIAQVTFRIGNGPESIFKPCSRANKAHK